MRLSLLARSALFACMALIAGYALLLPTSPIVHGQGAAAPLSHKQYNWPMFGFNPQHTHFNPHEKILSPSTVAHLVLDWSYATPGYLDTSPAIANGLALIGSSDGTIYAFNAGTGKIAWTYVTGGRVNSSPAVVNGIVYVGSQDDNLYALNATTGKVA